MRRGLLLFAHGARDPNWAVPFEAVARRAAERLPDAIVRLAFLEFMTPDLRSAGTELAEAGCTTVDVLPLFLGAGGHVRKDLPKLIAELAKVYPAVDWRLRDAVGEDEHVISAMADVAIASVRRA
jgi:sirohydrochlorin cobaltochelatase